MPSTPMVLVSVPATAAAPRPAGCPAAQRHVDVVGDDPMKMRGRTATSGSLMIGVVRRKAVYAEDEADQPPTTARWSRPR